VDLRTFTNVHCVQVNRIRKIVAAAAAEIIENGNGVLTVEERVDHVAADKACATSDKNPHSGPFKFSGYDKIEPRGPVRRIPKSCTMSSRRSKTVQRARDRQSTRV